MKRFFVRTDLGHDIVMTGAEHNHLANVLRVRAGEDVIICNGDEFDYRYTAQSISKNAAQMRFVGKELNNYNPKVKLSVFLALIKPENICLVVQKLNELGVSEITLFNSAYCNVAPKSVNIEKLRTIAEQSCKQCKRSTPITVNEILSFDTMCDCLGGMDTVIFADETTGSNIDTTPHPSNYPTAAHNVTHISDLIITANDRIAIIIGCEGGFTAEERAKLMKTALTNAAATEKTSHNKTVMPVSLGTRILRTETAAIAAAAAVMAKLGEL